MEDFQANLQKFSGQIKLVAVTGASNVTGFILPIYDMAEMAHEHGAMIAADCAQLLPHRKVNMGPHGSARRLDFITFSAHKLYAPLGSGGLVGSKEFFNQGEPDVRGGGTVEIVSLKEVTWTGAPEREEAGSPNVIGAIAMAASFKFLSEVGMEAIAAHEAALTRYTLGRMLKIPGIKIYGSTNLDSVEARVGVIPFALEGITHGKLAAILGFEGGIGVRNGCFCAHPYILHLLGVSDADYHFFTERVRQHNRADLPGLVRVSFGCYNNRNDVERLIEMLDRIARQDYRGRYVVHARTGNYYPLGFEPESVRGKYFTFS
jgi:cysteine desulfurase/selenocysteine lyase